MPLIRFWITQCFLANPSRWCRALYDLTRNNLFWLGLNLFGFSILYLSCFDSPLQAEFFFSLHTKKITQYNYVNSSVIVANDPVTAESSGRHPDDVTGLIECIQHLPINHVSSVHLPRLGKECDDLRVSSLKEVLDAECIATKRIRSSPRQGNFLFFPWLRSHTHETITLS